MKKSFILLLFVPFLSFSQYVFDGNEGCTEYDNADAPATQPNAGSSTCDVNEVYADIYNDGGTDYFIIGIEHGNSGQSNFRMYINTDCNTSTGQQLAREKFNSNSTPSIPVGGADYMVNFTTGNNNSSTVYMWNGTSMVVSNSAVVQSLLGNSCGGGDNFAEIRVQVQSVFQPCDDISCGNLELTSILSNSGNSTNSSYCDDVGLSLPVPVNLPPEVTYQSAMGCTYDENTMSDVPAICLDASGSSDVDMPDNGDELTYAWTVSGGSGEWTNQSGTATNSGDEMSTCFIPDGPGTYQFVLSVTDQFGCEDDNTADQTKTIVITEADIADQIEICELELPAPVKISSFVASGINDGVNISWSTVSEINTDFFSIERSTDGRFYEEIGVIKAAGNRNKTTKYEFMDKTIQEERYYYRLRIVDMDSSQEYSDVITAKAIGNSRSLNIFYTSGFLNCQYKINDSATINVLDQTGRTIQSYEVSNQLEQSSFQIDLPPGLYFINMYNSEINESQAIMIF